MLCFTVSTIGARFWGDSVLRPKHNSCPNSFQKYPQAHQLICSPAEVPGGIESFSRVSITAGLRRCPKDHSVIPSDSQEVSDTSRSVCEGARTNPRPIAPQFRTDELRTAMLSKEHKSNRFFELHEENPIQFGPRPACVNSRCALQRLEDLTKRLKRFDQV